MPRKKSPVVLRDVGADEAEQLLTAAGDPEGFEGIVAQIRYWHRQRCFAMEQRKRMDLALGAFLRTMLGWSKDKPDDERAEIAKRAAALLTAKGDHEWAAVIAAEKLARKPFADIEARALKEMSALAASLPVWAAFGESVRGFGSASLAVIVAEAGDLSNYSNPAKLWKRMGLAVMGDVRQGGLAKNSSAESWIAHGYSRQRRSRMWNIGDALIKGNRAGEYRTVYLERKAYEIARDPEMKPIKAHRRAQRYMEKRLLKKLWQAWRRPEAALVPDEPMAAANLLQTDEVLSPKLGLSAPRSAALPLAPVSPMPSAPIHTVKARAVKRRAISLKSTGEVLPAATSHNRRGPNLTAH